METPPAEFSPGPMNPHVVTCVRPSRRLAAAAAALYDIADDWYQRL